MNDNHRMLFLMLFAMCMIWTMARMDWAIALTGEIMRMINEGMTGTNSGKGAEAHRQLLDAGRAFFNPFRISTWE